MKRTSPIPVPNLDDRPPRRGRLRPRRRRMQRVLGRRAARGGRRARVILRRLGRRPAMRSLYVALRKPERHPRVRSGLHATGRGASFLAERGRSTLAQLRCHVVATRLTRRLCIGGASCAAAALMVLVSAVGGPGSGHSDASSAPEDESVQAGARRAAREVHSAVETLARAEHDLEEARDGAQRLFRSQAQALSAVEAARAMQLHHAVAHAHLQYARLRALHAQHFGPSQTARRARRLAAFAQLRPGVLKIRAGGELTATLRATVRGISAGLHLPHDREVPSRGLYQIALATDQAAAMPLALRAFQEAHAVALDLNSDGTFVLALRGADGLQPLHAGAWSQDVARGAIELHTSAVGRGCLDTLLDWNDVRLQLNERQRTARIIGASGEAASSASDPLSLFGPLLLRAVADLSTRLARAGDLVTRSEGPVRSALEEVRAAQEALAEATPEAVAAAQAEYLGAATRHRVLSWEYEIRGRRVYARAPIERQARALAQFLPALLEQHAYAEAARGLVEAARFVDALERDLGRASHAAAPFAAAHRAMAGEYALRDETPIVGAALSAPIAAYLAEARVRLRLADDGTYVLFAAARHDMPCESGWWTPEGARVQLATAVRGTQPLSEEQRWPQTRVLLDREAALFSIQVGPKAPRVPWIDRLRGVAAQALLESLRPVVDSPVDGALLTTTHVPVRGHVPAPLQGAVLRVNDVEVPLDEAGRFNTVIDGKTETRQPIRVSYEPHDGSQIHMTELSVELDPARPRIRVEVPNETEGLLGSRDLRIRGRVEDRRLAQVVLVIAGNRVSLDVPSEGPVSFDEMVRLDEGEEISVEVRATDAAGNRADWSKSLRHDEIKYHQKHAWGFALAKDWARASQHYDQVLRRGGRVKPEVEQGVRAWREPPTVRFADSYFPPEAAPELRGTITGLRDGERLLVGGRRIYPAADGSFNARFAQPLAVGYHAVEVSVEPAVGGGPKRLATQYRFQVGQPPTTRHTGYRTGVRGGGRRMSDAEKAALAIGGAYTLVKLLR